jgi:hypothetical protein
MNCRLMPGGSTSTASPSRIGGPQLVQRCNLQPVLSLLLPSISDLESPPKARRDETIISFRPDHCRGSCPRVLSRPSRLHSGDNREY